MKRTEKENSNKKENNKKKERNGVISKKGWCNNKSGLYIPFLLRKLSGRKLEDWLGF